MEDNPFIEIWGDNVRGIKKESPVSHANEGNANEGNNDGKHYIRKETPFHHDIEGSNNGNRYNGNIKKETPTSHDDEEKWDNHMAQSNSSSSMAAAPRKYPYPYNLDIANLVSIKLNQSNFLLWQTQMMGLIESQDMIGFLDGEYQWPAQFLTASDGSTTTKLNSDYLAW
ncbi:hypothetical protein EJ110_NYTH50213 [Nymphaea thermarum]|nr:hypothetical protein EJ110_NYTH50213 [Nymphaea thermarum]